MIICIFNNLKQWNLRRPRRSNCMDWALTVLFSSPRRQRIVEAALNWILQIAMSVSVRASIAIFNFILPPLEVDIGAGI